MAFATAADLATYLGEDPFTGNRLAQANLALDLATARIQDWTRQTLELVTDDVIAFVGPEGSRIELPERPVVDVTQVTVDGTVLGSASWVLSGVEVVRLEGTWGGIDTAVEVTYTHGYSPIPDTVRGATLQLAGQALQNPQSVAQESIGTYSISYGTEAGGAVTEDILASLSRYRRRSTSVRIRP